MLNTRKPVPEFHSEAEERLFWQSHDTIDCGLTARLVLLYNFTYN